MPVHFSHLNRVACMKPGLPEQWEDGHSGSENWEDVDCAVCLKGRDLIRTYTIAPDRSSITCLGCGMTSSSSDDVANRYCGHCHVAHDDIWPPSRRWFIDNTEKVVPQLCEA